MTDIDELVQRLISHAQNEEMIDQCLTDHGKDCVAAANVLERQQRDLKEAVELLRRAKEDGWKSADQVDALLARVKL
jgi:flagellar biosynthesis regulator FlaF